jgi:hypothetical protein
LRVARMVRMIAATNEPESATIVRTTEPTVLPIVLVYSLLVLCDRLGRFLVAFFHPVDGRKRRRPWIMSRDREMDATHSHYWFFWRACRIAFSSTRIALNVSAEARARSGSTSAAVGAMLPLKRRNCATTRS